MQDLISRGHELLAEAKSKPRAGFFDPPKGKAKEAVFWTIWPAKKGQAVTAWASLKDLKRAIRSHLAVSRTVPYTVTQVRALPSEGSAMPGSGGGQTVTVSRVEGAKVFPNIDHLSAWLDQAATKRGTRLMSLHGLK